MAHADVNIPSFAAAPCALDPMVEALQAGIRAHNRTIAALASIGEQMEAVIKRHGAEIDALRASRRRDAIAAVAYAATSPNAVAARSLTLADRDLVALIAGLKLEMQDGGTAGTEPAADDFWSTLGANLDRLIDLARIGADYCEAAARLGGAPQDPAPKLAQAS